MYVALYIIPLEYKIKNIWLHRFVFFFLYVYMSYNVSAESDKHTKIIMYIKNKINDNMWQKTISNMLLC